MQKLQDNFGILDATEDAEHKLSNLQMSDNDCLSEYTVKFNQYAALVPFDEPSLHFFFWKGPAPRLKGELSHLVEAASLHNLHMQVAQLDAHYWQCHSEHLQECAHSPSDSGSDHSSILSGSGLDDSDAPSGSSSVYLDISSPNSYHSNLPSNSHSSSSSEIHSNASSKVDPVPESE
ncbi:hypothetical protein VKT23_005881 [Stygiomarasmius scandens]|uniref:Retrotransposon gag domain-containing protein n=1 Tax=Marasmiellus scandens TaxID=2682957 RepID=A0ABR1JR66_9AGAR